LAGTEGQSEGKYKAAEVCRLADVQPYVLRYWETEFPFLAGARGASGPRNYSELDLKLIRRIKQLLYDEGYTIAGAKKRLEAELKKGVALFDDEEMAQFEPVEKGEGGSGGNDGEAVDAAEAAHATGADEGKEPGEATAPEAADRDLADTRPGVPALKPKRKPKAAAPPPQPSPASQPSPPPPPPPVPQPVPEVSGPPELELDEAAVLSRKDPLPPPALPPRPAPRPAPDPRLRKTLNELKEILALLSAD